MKFIITQSESVADALIKSGYEPLPNMGSGFSYLKTNHQSRSFVKKISKMALTFLQTKYFFEKGGEKFGIKRIK